MYRLFFPLSGSMTTTNTTLISLKILHRSSTTSTSSSSSPFVKTSFQNNNYFSRKYFTMSFYDLEASDIKKQPFNFSSWKGNVVLIVNVASKCGYTPQYTGLEELYNKYKSEGLVIAGFPCNQFGAQEPNGEEEIAKFCSNNYSVTFPLFAKIEVNGQNESPIYKHLKSQQSGDIQWNFEKFLIDKEGNVVKRYTCKVEPKDIVADIDACLKK